MIRKVIENKLRNKTQKIEHVTCEFLDDLGLKKMETYWIAKEVQNTEANFWKSHKHPEHLYESSNQLEIIADEFQLLFERQVY